MLKPFPKTNTGLEVHAILSQSHILILNGNAWGIQNDALWETCFIVITINLNCSGKYEEKINCQARELWLLSANCHRFFKMHAILFIEVEYSLDAFDYTQTCNEGKAI